MTVVPFAGFERCAQFDHAGNRLIVTLEVGPRVLYFGPIDGPNMLAVYQKDWGIKEDGQYHSYGGHRLWIAPEERPKTFFADSVAVAVLEEGDWFSFRCPADPYHISKEIAVKPNDAGGFTLRHRIHNHGVYSAKLAPWGITVMDPGGECLFPQWEYAPHPQNLLPARPIIFWPYTDMQDPRWTWGSRVIRLRQSTEGGPQKIGALIQQGVAVYRNKSINFVKRFGAQEGATYADFGCNFEVFTRHDMLEVESLGPLQSVAPGGFAEHFETWYLDQNSVPPNDDAACGEWIKAICELYPYKI